MGDANVKRGVSRERKRHHRWHEAALLPHSHDDPRKPYRGQDQPKSKCDREPGYGRGRICEAHGYHALPYFRQSWSGSTHCPTLAYRSSRISVTPAMLNTRKVMFREQGQTRCSAWG